MRANRVAVALIGCIVGTYTTRLNAQDLSSTVDSSDFRTDAAAVAPRTRRFVAAPLLPDENGEILVSASVKAVPEKFLVSVDLPATFAGNPEHARFGSTNAAHITPNLKFSFADSHGILFYSAGVAVTGDDFIGGSASDTSIVAGSVGAALWDRKKRLSILGAYAPKRVFADTFGAGTVTLHDLTIGVGRTFAIGLPTAALDLSYNRREASKPGFQQNQLTTIAVLKGDLGRDFGWIVRGQIQRRLFSDPASLERKDWNFSTLAEISRPLGKVLLLKLDVTFERNSSNIAAKRYSALDVGPKISFVKGF